MNFSSKLYVVYNDLSSGEREGLQPYEGFRKAQEDPRGAVRCQRRGGGAKDRQTAFPSDGQEAEGRKIRARGADRGDVQPDDAA
jgi:hypothetical protein